MFYLLSDLCLIKDAQDDVSEILACMSARHTMKTNEASSVGWQGIFVFWIINPMNSQSYVTVLVVISPEIFAERNLTSSIL